MNIMVNKIGLDEKLANLCYQKSKKYSVWLANQVIKNKEVIFRHNDIDLILDWKKERQDINLNEITFIDALKQAQEFQKSLFVPNSNGLKNTNVILDCGEYKWVQLLTKADCTEEGNVMGHCIGGSSHNTRISNGNSVAFSLRDKYNKPHITLEAYVKNEEIGNIFEFKGTANGVPKTEYTKYFIDLLKKYKFKGCNDYTFRESIERSFDVAKQIDEINNNFLPFDFKLKIGLQPFTEGDIYANVLEFNSDEKIVLPKNLSFYSDLKLEFTKEVKLEGDIKVGGDLTIKSKKVILGDNIQVGGNLIIHSGNKLKDKDTYMAFGKKIFENNITLSK